MSDVDTHDTPNNTEPLETGSWLNGNKQGDVAQQPAETDEA